VLLVMDQVEKPASGVVTRPVCQAAEAALQENPGLLVLADSRRGLHDFPPFGFKMNAAELGRMTRSASTEVEAVKLRAAELAKSTGQPVFVTLAERGIVGVLPGQRPEHVAAHPVRGPVDIVGAGDAVSANLAATLAAGASLPEAMEIAMAAASIVIHQLGTTGTASVSEIAAVLAPETCSPPAPFSASESR
jgi:bifunctional ADP-heptose synthase (sugar kinase/adenylyltransferase)